MTAPPRVAFHAEGVEVEGGLLWLDARRAKSFGVVSHAHGDHVARHACILCTRETAALVRRRSGPGPRFLTAPYGEGVPVGDLRVTLFPAGHILGSALVHIEGPGGSLLYSGDLRMEGGLTCPPAAPPRADLLITESTFGRPEHRFADAAETRASLVSFARETLAGGATPVFLAYALGKAQEVMKALCDAGVPVAAHGSIWNLCAVYRAFGIGFPRATRLSGARPGRRAIVVPPRFARAPEITSASPLRVAAVTGWGEMARGPDAPVVFRLSDHSDYDGLIAFVNAVQPRKVFVLHGYAAEFSADLRRRGYDAEAVPGHAGPQGPLPPGAFGRGGPEAG
ncbi:MAG: MBL fold metallo-hydrolase RNA specificity domain-containing protein [Planctomycetaceae bacterium]